jgi:hypothetical protein
MWTMGRSIDIRLSSHVCPSPVRNAFDGGSAKQDNVDQTAPLSFSTQLVLDSFASVLMLVNLPILSLVRVAIKGENSR